MFWAGTFVAGVPAMYITKWVTFIPATLGRAVQVDPIKPTLKVPGTKHLKLKYDTLNPRP
jgi:hypothetical protein